MRILVIDKVLRVARSIEEMLDDEVVGETDARAACRRIVDAEHQGAPFGAVLCDIAINELRATDILRVARARDEPPLFILMTTESQLDEAAWLADGVLIKPFRREEVVTTIARLVLRRSRAITRRMRAVLPN